MPTPAITRAAPPRRFESYILTRVVDPSVGLTDVPEAAFTPCSPNAEGYDDPGVGFASNALSVQLPIGFDFNFDNIVYNQFVVSNHGWLALVDPTTGTFSPAEVMSGNIYQNPDILATFTSNAVLLCPWFDDSQNVASDPTQLSAASFSQAKITRLQYGSEPMPFYVNGTAHGVRYCNDVRSSRGRRLIVRWSTITSYQNILSNGSSVISFEVVIYENGTIEFRYAPRLAILNTTAVLEGATIGVFMPNGTHRFRDFAIGLGDRDGARQEYVYGGFTYDPNFTDTTSSSNEEPNASAPYVISLTTTKNWPGLSFAGSVFTFSPPVNRRKVLPRLKSRQNDGKIQLPLVARTGDDRLGTYLSMFDDRKSPTFATSGINNQIVNYPSTLPRFFGGTGVGTLQRQDLFSNDMLVTGSIVKSAVEPYLGEGPQAYVSAFNEAHRPEQSVLGTTDKFFVSGSDVNYVGIGLTESSRSKTQVRLALPINTSTQMPGVTSSIYYYNARTKAWEVPANSSYVLGNSATTNVNGGGDWKAITTSDLQAKVLEDGRGFGAIGQILSSGSNAPITFGETTDAYMGPLAPFTPSVAIQAITREIPKSVRIDARYAPTADETFTLPINQPFLIEKAVIELPFQAGNGWFKDATRAFSPGEALLFGVEFTSADLGGPGITVALMRHVQEAESTGSPSRRDLILTGTLTHTLDYVSGVIIDTASPSVDTGIYHVNPIGFSSYTSAPSAVVTPLSDMTFTGSVSLKCEALTSVGVMVHYFSFIKDTSTNIVNALKTLMTETPVLALSNSAGIFGVGTYQTSYISGIAPFGRGATGFVPSGRSVFGNEMITFQGLFDQTTATIKNPFYVGPDGLTQQQEEFFNNPPTSFTASVATAIPMISHFPSPYLVMPGDKLVLSISKMRPYVLGGKNFFSGSNASHDVVLKAGNINITLYGSLLQEGVEYHDTLNQPLGSDAVHELIGADPVTDQFDVAYDNELSGSMTDNVMLGNMLTSVISNGQLSFVQATRDRKLSKLGAETAPPLTTNNADLNINPYWSYRLQPWKERVGSVQLTAHVSNTERYYDSLMPALDQCFAADGTGFFILKAPIFGYDDSATVSFSDIIGDYRRIDAISVNSISTDVLREHPAYIFLDGTRLGPSFNGEGTILNTHWNSAFPFEPRYSQAIRQLAFQNSIVASYIYISSVSSNPIPIDPTPCSGLIPCFASATPGGSNNNAAYWMLDANFSQPLSWAAGFGNFPQAINTYNSSSMPIDDLARVMYGFGDVYNRYTNGNFGHPTGGANHVADTRQTDTQLTNWGLGGNNRYKFSPVIRGWKYGVFSGLPTFSKAYWRRNRFGQFRDMLEQRPFTKYYETPEQGPVNLTSFQQGTKDAAVTVKFISPDGRLTDATNTWTSNLHFECTSSLPYFDGVSTNRPPINPQVLNKNIITLQQDVFGNVSL